MFTQNSRFYSLILVIVDMLFLLSAFIGAYVARVTFDHRPLTDPVYAKQYLLSSLIIVPAWILIFAILGLYQPSVYNRRLAEWGRITVGAFIGILLVIGWQYVTKEAVFPARLVAAYTLVGSTIVLILEREIIRTVRSQLFKRGHGVKRVLLIGSDATTADIAHQFANTQQSGYQLVAVAGPKKMIPKHVDVVHFSRVEAALEQINMLNITAIIQANLFEDTTKNQKVLSASQTHHIAYSFIPGEAEFYSGKNAVDIFLGYPMINVYQTPLIGWGAIVKRCGDLALVIITSPAWLLLLLVLAFLQKIGNPGPVIFKSTRLGRHGKPFTLYKLRSMKQQYSGQDAIKIFHEMNRPDLAREYKKTRKITNDPRITPLGKFLRATSLDELPQIFNVIEGDMSLVGPRPILPDEKGFYKDRGSLLFSVKPGITGLWQVSGRSDLDFEGRVDLELYYAQSWSYLLDIRIMLKTLRVVLFQKGAK